MRHLRQLSSLWLMAFVVLAGCKSLGIQPDSFNKRLALGYYVVTSTRDTARILLDAGKVSADDAQNAQDQADNFRAALDIARTISATDPQAADSRLTAALTGLNALDAYLKTRGAP